MRTSVTNGFICSALGFEPKVLHAGLARVASWLKTGNADKIAASNTDGLTYSRSERCEFDLSRKIHRTFPPGLPTMSKRPNDFRFGCGAWIFVSAALGPAGRVRVPRDPRKIPRDPQKIPRDPQTEIERLEGGGDVLVV
ncbi:hypothetical protein EVAR_5330_1 [Eumeta japonica]|uniref:Uncharacterized protein n=1 Tax=Eumeta variegata TaxID=151549 RepID=A0A4C1TMV3_EUMVA|nr:hypothetical protein EVAR_5330_1 [Eumeta japonica]